MTIRIVINGFGRIGRNVVRASYGSGRRTEATVVAINELADVVGTTHLLKYDISHSRFAWDVRQEREQLFAGDDAIRLLYEPITAMPPWHELAVGVVLDCTGVYGDREHDKAHLQVGAKRVLFSHPDGNDPNTAVVCSVNQGELRAERCIVSNTSRTTSCVIPIIKLSDGAHGIESDTVTTTHSVMYDQQVTDACRPDLRCICATNQSVTPVDTEPVAGIARTFPQFNDRLEVIVVWMPTINMTAIDLSVMVKKPVKACEVSQSLQKAARGAFHGIADYTELSLVPTDFNHDPHSAIVGGTQVQVSGVHLIKTLAWCGDKWGSANQMPNTTLVMTATGFKSGA